MNPNFSIVSQNKPCYLHAYETFVAENVEQTTRFSVLSSKARCSVIVTTSSVIKTAGTSQQGKASSFFSNLPPSRRIVKPIFTLSRPNKVEANILARLKKLEL